MRRIQKLIKRLQLLSLLLFSILIFSQNKVVKGSVYNAEQNDVLPYANIFLKNTAIGTMSNSNGEFLLVIPKENVNDSLIVSFVGFKSQTIHVLTTTKPLSIYLEEDKTILNEVVITSYTAKSIINKAIKNIPKNYFVDPYISKGFYRVTSQKDNSYIHLSEAVFDIYQSKISKPNKQFKLEKMRALKDEKASKGIDLGLRPDGIYEFDIVNNTEIALFGKKGYKLHDYKIDGTTIVNGKEAYKIVFDQKNVKKSGYKGYMLIDKETFAFVYFDFGLSPKGLAYHKYGDASLRRIMKIVGINISMNKNDYQIQYKKIGNKYYLNFVGNDATLHFISNRAHYNFKADTRVDYLVTKIEQNNVKPFTNEEILSKGKFIENQNSTYDADFWKDYNIMLSTNDFNEISKILEANNLANNTKLEIEKKLSKLPKNKTIRIDSILSFYNSKELFNGNALITYEGETIIQKSYNNDLTENDEDSQFRIGSLSKTFVSMIFAQLENEAKLNYSDAIETYLPNYKHGKITISQLLSHQSGIPDFLSNKDYIVKILSDTFSSDAVVNQFCSDSLEFEPGSKFSYSNSNFVILSLIAEKITGMSYNDILNQFILNPLQMNDTYFGKPTDSTNLVTAFLYGKPEPKYDIQNVVGAGGITSTSSDLLKWSNALSNNTLLPQSKIDKLLQPHAEYTDWEAYYGYGWMIDKYMFSASKDAKIFYHPGTDFGFYTMFLKLPDSGITIILLNNTGEFPRFEITELILNELN